MSNLIQIKRSNTSSSPTTTLNSGELAYSYNSNAFYVGAQTGVGATAVRIGGYKYGYLDQVTAPGVLTSNSAMVVDANSFISNVFSQGLFLHNSEGTITVNSSASYVNAISSQANSSQLGSINSAGSNNELATTGAITTYVQAQVIGATTPAGANGQFQYNNSGTIAGTSNFTYNNTIGVVSVGNTTTNVQMGFITSTSATLTSFGSVNNYVQIAHQNPNSGPAASADFAAYNDVGGLLGTNFIDMGINSSQWSNTLWTINGPNDGYLFTGNGALTLGSNLAAGYVNFFTGGTLTTNEKLRIGINTITVANSVSITANGSAGTLGQVLTSNGSGLYWSSGSGGVNAAAQIAWTNTQSFSNTITFSGAILANTVNATSVTIGSSVVMNSSNLYAPAVFAQFADLSVSGNLTVSGVVTTINTQQLTVNDNIIELASNNRTSDSVDFGLYAPAGNSTSVWYSGIGRIASKSSNNSPYFQIFASNTNPNTSPTFDLSASNSATGTLQAYLAPYGVGGGLIANTSNVQITANSTLGVNFSANTLVLSSALLATSGGTGVNTYAAGDILYAGTSNPTALSKLSIPGSVANGQVLMITNNLPAYGSLDGGTF